MRKPRLKFLFLYLLLAGVVLPQASSVKLVTPEIRRVGDHLACKCGVCNNTVATCQMLECHYSSPAREKIGKMQAEGAKDDAIIASFVQEGGVAALAAPPTTGFNLLGYILPFILLTLGTIGITYWLNRLRRPKVVPVDSLPPIDARYQARIEKEMAEID